MAQGLGGGYGHINARIPMPIGGGATASAPVGAIMQKLMAMYGGGDPRMNLQHGQGSAPAESAPPPDFDAKMAELLGLMQESERPQRGGGIGSRAPQPQQQSQGAQGGGGSGGMASGMNPIAGMIGFNPAKNPVGGPLYAPMAKAMGGNPLINPLLRKSPLESLFGG